MKILKKILYLFLIIFTISFSLDGEKSKVVLDKSDRVAELKIGVTKLISKELPLEFHVDSKKIYGEIDIEDNDLVFVSETLDEMPSVSTTNGRKAINNIKKYLTKEIKKAPKFEYQIINGKDEGDRENGKKYLLVDCKEQLSDIYIYVVEQGTYKVKTVYRGIFKQLLNANAKSVNYGTIHFTKEHPLTSRISRVDYDGTSISVDGRDTDSIIVEGMGGFPKKFVGDLSGRLFKGYKIRVKNLKTGSITTFPAKHYKYFEDGRTTSENKIISMEINLCGELLQTGTEANKEEVIGKLKVISKPNSEYLSFEVKLNYSMIDIENEISIDYGNSAFGDDTGTLHVLHTDTFKIKIDGKEVSNLPPNTEGTLAILKGEHLHKTVTKIYVEDEKEEVKNNNLKADIQFEGKYLKVFNFENIEVGKKVVKITVENRNGLSKSTTIEKVLTDENGNDIYGGEFILYDNFGVEAGKIDVRKKNPKDKYFTLEISDFKDITDTVNSNIIIEYISRSPDGNKESDKVIKEDFIVLYVNPREPTPLKGTHGELILYSVENLRNNDFYMNDGVITTKKSGNSGDDYIAYNKKNCRYSNLPLPLKNNQGGDTPWIYWGHGAQILIDGPNYSGKFSFENRDNGTFKTKKIDDSGWVRLVQTDREEAKKAFIQFNMEDNLDSLTIGFRGSITGINPIHGGPFKLNKPESTVDSVYHFKYQVKLKGKDKNGNFVDKWLTIKEDTLRVVIDPTMKISDKTIKLLNPLVYYDYNSSSAISNIVHNRRVHIAGNEAKTLTSGGAQFTKNTDLAGNNWIETVGKFNSYEKFKDKKHKVTIRKGGSEVVKMTDKNGRTPSSTFIGDTDTVTSNSRDGRGNEVMFSYDGGNNYLNFGLSKYNFEKTTISNISITNNGIVKDNDSSQTDTTSETEIISVEIPKFEGIHYVNPNYDIKPKQDYIKHHEFDNATGNKEITIDYGTVGFRDLDTRITHQSGGDGIEIRAYTKVILQSVSDPSYIIKGAELYFEDRNFDGDVTYFKGENERATSKLLKLKIPTQETLIPKDNFKILRADTMGYPLEVGVTVNKDKTKYYTPIDNEPRENGAEGKNLYLNLTTRRYVETTIEFENPSLSVLDADGKPTNEINWIKLNKTQYSGGRLTSSINNSDLWGRVRGEVIDIPVKYGNKVYDNLILKVFQQNPDGNEQGVGEEDLTDKQISFVIPEEPKDSNGNSKNFVMKYDKGNNFIEFSLDKGYTDNIAHKDIVFYIRYMDGNTKDKDGKPLFLFDQKYTVRFKKKVDYLADSTLILKNPSMASEQAGNNGRIELNENGGKSLGNSNETTEDNINYDSIKWYEVQNGINYIDKAQANEYILRKIGSDEKYKYYEIKDGNLQIGIPNIQKEFTSIFGDSNLGKEKETSFSLEAKYNNADSKYYRVNVILEEFDPRYYGKVYAAGTTESTTYSEINSTGTGTLDLREYISDENIYIDLGTTYRDYSRYKSIPESIFNSQITIGVLNETQVDVVAKDNGKAPVVKGEIVFKDGMRYETKKVISTLKIGDNSSNAPKTYPLYLKLTQAEYRKLRPYTNYEIFLNGNQNVLTFDVTGDKTLNKEMLFNKPLSFETKGASLRIETDILDFGEIKPKEHKETLITVEKNAEIRVIVEDRLAEQFTTVLEPETEEIWIHEKNTTNEIMKNGEKLKVRSITITNKTQNEKNELGQRQDNFDISGVLEVPNKTEPKRGKYGGYIRVNCTYY